MSGVVGETVDLDIGVGITDYRLGKACEVSLGLCAEGGSVGGEEYTAVKGYFDSLQTVLVGGLFYLGLIGEFLLEFFLLFVHTVTDKSTAPAPTAAPIAEPMAAPLPPPMSAPMRHLQRCAAATADECTLTVLVIEEQPVSPMSIAPQISAMQESFKIFMSVNFMVEVLS